MKQRESSIHQEEEGLSAARMHQETISSDHPSASLTDDPLRSDNNGALSSDMPPSSSSSSSFSSATNNSLHDNPNHRRPMIHPQARPNQQLTKEEKLAKRHLKRHLKQRIRIRKYEMRWSQACGRNDTLVANQAESELRDYLALLQREPDSLWYQPDFPSPYRDFLQDPTCKHQVPILYSSDGTMATGGAGSSDDASPITESWSSSSSSDTLEKSRQWMTREIWQVMILRMVPESSPTLAKTEHGNGSGRSRKQKQTTEARSLLNHMTKGTQTESMFENDAALIGYTRQKFMERALLAVKSLDRLRPLVKVDMRDGAENDNLFPNQLWQRLLQVRSVLSIGCGPGCDAIGVMTFLYQQQEQRRQQQKRDNDDPSHHPILDRIILLDYVMPRWKRLVIDHLIPILTTTRPQAKKKMDYDADAAPADPRTPLIMVSQMDTAACDVRYSLTRDARNCEAWNCLVKKKGETMTDNNIHDTTTTVDLIVVSYLLTETRDQWIDFFRDFFQEYCPHKECLILLSEPSAWQLHSFLTLFADFLQGYQWLDSSRDSPDLQPMEGRSGPAVVLIQTKATVEKE